MSYTQDWSKEFIKNTAFIDRNSLENVIEIGCYEGRTSNYIVENLLTEDGELICIDPLDDAYELDSDNIMFQGQFDRFKENTAANKKRIRLIRNKSAEVLNELPPESADLVFIDGHHAEAEAYYDGSQAFRLCKDWGYIIWDDYNWGGTKPVKAAVERVLAENVNHLLFLKLNQVIVQKLPKGSQSDDNQDRYQNMSIGRLFNANTIYAAYCNLEIRTDRRELMEDEIKKLEWDIPVERLQSSIGHELYESYDEEQKKKVEVMYKRTPGAIGCYMSQMDVMREALRQGKHAIVFEDDLVFCNDFTERLKIIYKFLNQHEWDVFWFGGTYHKDRWWHGSVEGRHTNPDLQQCHCNLNRDYEPTFDKHIVRTFGAFSTHAYMVNKDRLGHILAMLERVMPISMGIDWSFILEQPNLNCYAFVPGCIIQHDNPSNIGNGVSYFSGFHRLGKHWYAPTMSEYNYDEQV